MSLQILTPDFGSSAFPLRSASPEAPTVARKKRVTFARQLTDEYEIASRHCRRRLPVSIEELRNRVLRLRRELDIEYEVVNAQEQLELDLEEKNAAYEKYADVTILLKLKKSIGTLETGKERLEEDIACMRMDTLRLKGVQKSVMSFVQNAKVEKKWQTGRRNFSLARGLWMSTIRTRPTLWANPVCT